MCCTRPVPTTHLFPPLLDSLIEVLASLGPEEWTMPTPCPGWSVHDLAAHIFGDDVGQLSSGRDGFHTSPIDANDWDSLVLGLNDLNEQWVRAMKRVSPQLMIDLLKSAGDQVNSHLRSLDPCIIGPVVSWASPEPAPMWLHIAREYTERWHHQQQIREAVCRPLLTDPVWFAPVLATFARGLARAYCNVIAPTGTMVEIRISGPSGGTWIVARNDAGWMLCDGRIGEPAAQVVIDEIDAWKLFTKSPARDIVERRIVIEGDRELGSKALDTVSMIA